MKKEKTLTKVRKGLDLLDCYNIPSTAKQEIYKSWWYWAKQNNVKDFGIDTYNGFMFTLTGRIEIDGQEYAIYITKTRQELYRIV